MGLFVKRDKDDKRSRAEVASAVEEHLARKFTRRCSLFCGDVECPEKCTHKGRK